MKDCRLRIELANYLKDCINNGIDDDGKFSNAVLDAVRIVEEICDYVEGHGTISLRCGSEWMSQDDNGQINALDTMGIILDNLEDYAEEDEEE